jgi:thioredoxin 1
MALCCVGGVCIPYTALLPLLVLGLQWIVKKLAEAGLLPASWTSTLHRYLQRNTTKDSCCDNQNAGNNGNHLRRGKQSKVSDLTAAAAACCVSNHQNSTTNGVVHCTTQDEWESLVRTTTAPAVVVKFTAAWCQPCQKIQPVFAALADAATSTTEEVLVQWATVDVDGCDGLASHLQVLSLPTFLLLDRHTQKVIGTSYSGSDEKKLQAWWKVTFELAKKMS